MSAVPVPYKYDAFIAHSSKDKRIVEEVLQQLEERGITCCYSRRDNVAGVDIISFMENAVVCSRKTIAFISKDFLESPYCKKERDLALLKAVKTGKDVLIPLILDDVAFENLPMALCGITCLEIGRKHFLSRLLKAMGVEHPLTRPTYRELEKRVEELGRRIDLFASTKDDELEKTVRELRLAIDAASSKEMEFNSINQNLAAQNQEIKASLHQNECRIEVMISEMKRTETELLQLREENQQLKQDLDDANITKDDCSCHVEVEEMNISCSESSDAKLLTIMSRLIELASKGNLTTAYQIYYDILKDVKNTELNSIEEDDVVAFLSRMIPLLKALSVSTSEKTTKVLYVAVLVYVGWATPGKDGLDHYSEALGIVRNMTGHVQAASTSHRDVAWVLFRIGNRHRKLGCYDLAEKFWRESLEMRKHLENDEMGRYHVGEMCLWLAKRQLKNKNCTQQSIENLTLALGIFEMGGKRYQCKTQECLDTMGKAKLAFAGDSYVQSKTKYTLWPWRKIFGQN